MSNLVVQLWGIGNLVQTEPLLRKLESGTLLLASHRGTPEMAPLFPDWKITTNEIPVAGYWDDIYLCGPWLSGANFAQIGNRVHVCSWAFKSWNESEARCLYRMAGADTEWAIPSLLRLEGWDLPRSLPYVVLSRGYNRHEPGWDFKDMGDDRCRAFLAELNRQGVLALLVGKPEDWGDFGKAFKGGLYIADRPLMDQIKMVSGCLGYIGNDTGWSHICGAYNIPSLIYMRTDPTKNQTGAQEQTHFDNSFATKPLVDWLLHETGVLETSQKLRVSPESC